MTVSEVREYALVNTSACSFKRALGVVERYQRLEVIDPPAGRRRGSFGADSLRIQFAGRIVQS